MYFRSTGSSQLQLVENLVRQGVFSSERVKQVLLDVDRTDYTNSTSPYADYPQRIGWGATISAPHMHAAALQGLEPVLSKENARVLDVGSGSGYLAAALALLTGPTGKVYGIEHIEQLADESVKNIRKNHAELMDNGRVKIIVGDGRLGYPQGAPYDAIHVGAAASETPKALIDQMAIGGRMLIPVGDSVSQDFLQIDKVSDNEVTRKVLNAVIYVPLTSKDAQLGRN